MDTVFLRIRKRFHDRHSEWAMAAIAFGYGLTLLAPGPTFSSPSYQAFNDIAREEFWGNVIAGTGLVWLLGLFINGMRQRTTRRIRAVCSVIGFVVFGMLAAGFVLPYAVFIWSLSWPDFFRFVVLMQDRPDATYLSTGAWVYFVLSCLSVYNFRMILREPAENYGA